MHVININKREDLLDLLKNGSGIFV